MLPNLMRTRLALRESESFTRNRVESGRLSSKGYSSKECDFQLLPVGISGAAKLLLVLLAQFRRHRRHQARRPIPNIELGGNMVAHSAITESAREFFRVQLLGKA